MQYFQFLTAEGTFTCLFQLAKVNGWTDLDVRYTDPTWKSKDSENQ